MEGVAESEEEKRVAIGRFFGASGNKNIGATISIGREIPCLSYAGFFIVQVGRQFCQWLKFLPLIVFEEDLELIH